MISIRKSCFTDYLDIELRPEQQLMLGDGCIYDLAKAETIIYGGYTLLTDGKPIAIANITRKPDGTYYAYGIFSCSPRQYMVPVFKACQRFLRMYKGEVIEIHVLDSDRYGHRFANLLGFKYVRTLREFNNGFDFSLYEMRH